MQVVPRAEGLPAGPGEDAYFLRGVLLKAPEGLGQEVGGRGVDGVAEAGPVDGYESDTLG